jgi:chaperonin GroEL (HSP60 family)
MVFVRGCKNPKAVSILIRGGTEHVIDEIERAMTDALGGISAAVEVGSVVAGGGAPEMEVAQKIRKYADTISGREQLAVNAFADAMEIIPRTLAESAGMDAIDTLVKLRSKHEEKDGTDYGVLVDKAKIDNMWSKGVIEPLKIKTQAVQSAAEAAEMLLRIDDVISTKSAGGGAGMPPGGGMPPGMGGMGD